MTLDHLILKVNDLDASAAFYTSALGFVDAGSDGPFRVLRVGPIDAIFQRIRAANMDYGPTFDSVGRNTGPGEETGARGLAPTLYFFDPNKYLLEIRTYE